MKRQGWFAAIVLALLCGFVWWTGGKNQAALRSEITVLRAGRLEAQARADSLSRIAAKVRERAGAAEAALQAERARAGETASRQERVADSLGRVVIQTGEEARQAVQEALGGSGDDVLAILDAHLEDDRRAGAAWRETVRLRDELLALADSMTGTWRMRALAAEEVVDAREVECQLCRREVDLLRQVAEPGVLERIRRGLPWAGAGSLGALALVLLL